MRPIGNRVVVRRDEPEGKSAGGILLPDVAKNRPMRGTVVAVGPGRMRDDGSVTPMQLAAGDRVLFTNYTGSEVEVDGEKLLVMVEEDVLAVVE